MSRRVIAIIAIVTVLVVGGLIDRRDNGGKRSVVSTAAAAAEQAPAGLMPVAAPTDALNSSWYCPAATAAPGGPADGLLVIFNPTDRPQQAAITVVPSQGDPKRVDAPIGPRSVKNVWLKDVASAPMAAALVDLDGGGGVVELFSGGPTGWDGTACATSASRKWYFATGSTDRDNNLSISLFNPFPEDAVVDLIKAFKDGRLPNSLDDPRYFNIKMMQKVKLQ